MEDNSEQDKSEDATPYKLSRSRQKGVVARGADLSFLTGVAAAAGLAWFGGTYLVGQVAAAAKSALISASTVSTSQYAILSVTGSVLGAAARPVAFAAAGFFLVVLLVEIIQTGLVFSTTPLTPDFSRLNPAKNLKRIFSVRMLFETAKNVFKLTLYAAIAYGVILFAQGSIAEAVTDASSLVEGMRRASLRLLFFFALAAAAFAVLDQLIVRRDFAKRMRMSRREVKREAKDREGDPRMKHKRKQLHAEFVKLSQSVRNIRRADLLITNPDHYAVALRYDPKTMAAPMVVSRGAYHLALRLKRLAFLYGVVIVQNPPLARALYHRCELNRPVTDTFYQPLADIYLAMREKKWREQQGPAHV